MTNDSPLCPSLPGADLPAVVTPGKCTMTVSGGMSIGADDATTDGLSP